MATADRLDPRSEWIDVTTYGDAEPQYVRGRCLHIDTVPVEAGGERVATLCLTCDAQLPAMFLSLYAPVPRA